MKIGDKVNYDAFPDIVNGTGVIVEVDGELCVESTDLTRDYAYKNGMALLVPVKDCDDVRLFFNIINDKKFKVNWYEPTYSRLELNKPIEFFCTNKGYEEDEILKINKLKVKEVLFLDDTSIERLK